MIASALLLLLAALSGTVLTWLYVDEAPLPVRLLGGAATGFLILPLVGYLAALPFGLGPLSNLMTAGVLLVPLLWFKEETWRERLRQALSPWKSPETWQEAFKPMIAGLLLLLAVVVIFPETVYQRDDDIWTGDYSNLGDLPFHFSIAQSFWRGGNIPPQDTELSGHALAYPFLVDFMTAQFYSLGAGLTDAMTLQNCALAAVLFLSIGLMAGALTGDRRAGALAPWLVLFSGGLGFIMLHQEAQAPGWLGLGHLTASYTIRDNSVWRWPNSVYALLMPQRSLLIGLPVLMWVGWLMWRMTDLERGPARDRVAVGAGLLTGALVLGHTYAALAAGAAGLCLAFLFWEPQSWGRYLAVSIATALPQMLWLSRNLNAGGFLAWSPGWDHGTTPIGLFWLENAGLTLPLLILWLARATDRQRRFYAPFLLMLLGANLLRLAPWIWDNIKVLFPAFLFTVPGVALMVARTSRQGLLGLVLAAVLMLGLCLSGTLDVWRIVTQAGELKEFTADEVWFADQVAHAAGGRPVVVLHAMNYDSSIYLSGALSVEGYNGHIWSRGLNAGTRENDIRAIYQGVPSAQALLAEYHVDFIADTPQEQETYQVNEAFLSQFKIVVDGRGCRLYQVISH